MMKNIFVPFSIMQLLLLVWIHFNWDSGGLSDTQTCTLISVVLLILIGGLWYSFRHTTWMRPVVIAVTFSQCAIAIVLKGVGIINWEVMLAIFIAWQVLMVLCTSPATPGNPTPPPAITTAPVEEKTPGE